MKTKKLKKPFFFNLLYDDIGRNELQWPNITQTNITKKHETTSSFRKIR